MAKKKKGSAPKNTKPPAKATADSSPAASAAVAESKGGFDLVKFLSESRDELAKIVWPSRQQLIGESVTVILMVTLVATTIYLVDNLFVWISTNIFS